jgi:RNA polymerase sigma-70 factor (ECF subfamily)
LSRTEVAVGFLARPNVVDVREALLVERLKATESEAFDELVLLYRDPVARIAYRMIGNSCEASDVSEEIFLSVFRNIRSFSGDLPLRTWIFRIALSEIRNWLRWWRRKYRSASAPLWNDETGQDAAIQEGLRRLSKDHRLIIVLRDMEGFSYAEIADFLGISIKSLSSRLARARGEMRKVLQPYLPV